MMVGGSMFSWVAHYINFAKKCWRLRHDVLDFVVSAVHLVRVLMSPTYVSEKPRRAKPTDEELVLSGIRTTCERRGVAFKFVDTDAFQLETYFEHPVSVATRFDHVHAQGYAIFHKQDCWVGQPIRRNKWLHTPSNSELIASSIQEFDNRLGRELAAISERLLVKNRSVCQFFFILQRPPKRIYRTWEVGVDNSNHVIDLGIHYWCFGYTPLWCEAEYWPREAV